MTGKMRVLIAYDGSECADAALGDLRRAGLPGDVEAVVFSVADVFTGEASAGVCEGKDVPFYVPGGVVLAQITAARAVEEARSLSERAAGRVREMFPSWDVRPESCADSPALGIIGRAEALQADLIVVGSHGLSAFERVLLGSVSQKVLTHAGCSVRVSRRRPGVNETHLRVIVGVDGSQGSDAAVRAAASRRWPEGSAARAVLAFEPVMHGVFLPRLLEDPETARQRARAERAWAEGVADRAASALARGGLRAAPVVKGGDARRVLLDEAEEWGADVIFVGARGLRGVERFLLGSVSTAVASGAHCSVEVVRGVRE